MGSCTSCCRSEGSKKRNSQVKEETTQTEDEKVSAEKVAEEQIAASVDKQKAATEKNVSVSKELSTQTDERRRLSKESDQKPPSLEKAPSANEQLSKQSAEDKKMVVPGFKNIKKEGKIGSREKAEAKKQDDNSESDVVDYWLTAEEREKTKSKSKELSVDKTTDLVLSVVQPPQVDYAALPPHVQANLRKKELSSNKPPQAAPVWTGKESSDKIRQPEAYGVADRPLLSVPSARKSVASYIGKESPDKIRQPESYGVADRPLQTVPSARKPVAPQAYGVADRPIQQNQSAMKRAEHAPEAYGVADRPILPKPQAQPQRAYGVVDRPSAPASYASSQRKPSAAQYYQATVDRGPLQHQPYANETVNANSAQLKAENFGNQGAASPAIQSYKLYGEKGFTVKSNERSDYGF